PGFVLNCDLPMINVRANWLRFGAFRSPPALPSTSLTTGHYPLAPRPTLHASRQTSGVRSCADPPPLATACHRPPNCQRPNGTRSRRAAPLCQYVTEIQYVTEPGNFFGLIHPFLPARRRPTV